MARLTEEYSFTCPCGREHVAKTPEPLVCECGRRAVIQWKADYMVLPAGD